MALPEYVGPVLAASGLVSLLLVVLRFGPHAYLRLLAGTLAVLTHDPTRRAACLDVLRILGGGDQSPPALPSDQPPDSGASDS